MSDEKQSIFTDVVLEVSKQLEEITKSLKEVAPTPFMQRKTRVNIQPKGVGEWPEPKI